MYASKVQTTSDLEKLSLTDLLKPLLHSECVSMVARAQCVLPL